MQIALKTILIKESVEKSKHQYYHITVVFEPRRRHMSTAVACAGIIKLPVLDHAL